MSALSPTGRHLPAVMPAKAGIQRLGFVRSWQEALDSGFRRNDGEGARLPSWVVRFSLRAGSPTDRHLPAVMPAKACIQRLGFVRSWQEALDSSFRRNDGEGDSPSVTGSRASRCAPTVQPIGISLPSCQRKLASSALALSGSGERHWIPAFAGMTVRGLAFRHGDVRFSLRAGSPTDRHLPAVMPAKTGMQRLGSVRSWQEALDSGFRRNDGEGARLPSWVVRFSLRAGSPTDRHLPAVMPAKAGMQRLGSVRCWQEALDSGFRRNDGEEELAFRHGDVRFSLRAGSPTDRHLPAVMPAKTGMQRLGSVRSWQEALDSGFRRNDGEVRLAFRFSCTYP